jgi:hypothetical protein
MENSDNEGRKAQQTDYITIRAPARPILCGGADMAGDRLIQPEPAHESRLHEMRHYRIAQKDQ